MTLAKKKSFGETLSMTFAFFEGVHCSFLARCIWNVASADSLTGAWQVAQTASLHELAAAAALIHFVHELTRHYRSSQ